MFFLLDFWNKVSAMYLGACPITQWECQKLALSTLPTVTNVEAWKRSLSTLSLGMSSAAQGLSRVFPPDP
jgi:hypothetical protein